MMKTGPAKIWSKNFPTETMAGVKDGARQRLDITGMERRPNMAGKQQIGEWVGRGGVKRSGRNGEGPDQEDTLEAMAKSSEFIPYEK